MNNAEKGNHRNPYPSYKDSKASWIGKIPIHWNILPNRAIFSEINEREYPSEEMLSVTIGQGVIRQATLLEDDSQKDGSRTDKSAYKLVQPGDIAYNKMRAWQGAIGVSNYRGIISPAYVVERPRGLADPKYLHYILRTTSFAKEAERWSYGITSDMWSLRAEHFKVISCCVPPLDEQAAIVRYLDEADQQIQAYISAKEKLIALLEEQRQAIIHQSVTRGLDPNVKLKPSGVEWLGDVPEHWEDASLKRLSLRIQNGATPPTEQQKYYDNGTVPWYGPSSWTTQDGATQPIRELNIAAFNEGKARLIQEKALLIVVIGATAGRMTLLPRQGSTNQQITAFEINNKKAIPLFLLHQFRQAEEWLRATASTATIPIISSSVLNSLPAKIPPLSEQLDILGHLEGSTKDIDSTAKICRRQIDLMEEYRTRLIADVVTGKLDVR